jgi:hypothetical protein
MQAALIEITISHCCWDEWPHCAPEPDLGDRSPAALLRLLSLSLSLSLSFALSRSRSLSLLLPLCHRSPDLLRLRLSLLRLLLRRLSRLLLLLLLLLP